LAFGVEYGLYHRLLRDPLRTHDPGRIRPALVQWLKVTVAWQVIVLVGCALYLVAFGSRHGHSVAWVSPAVGAVFGTAFPLQFVVMAIMRSMRVDR
jgi:hypothetical protein